MRNWFGGSSDASTELLDGMHYRGLLRVVRRDAGTRVYAAREPWLEHGGRKACQTRMDALVDLVVAAHSLCAPTGAIVATTGQCAAQPRTAPQWADDRNRWHV